VGVRRMNPYDFYVTPEEYEIAEANGISYRMVNHRIRSLGWEKQRALTTPAIIRNRHLNEDFVKMAKANGINREIFAYRVTHGWSEEDAATKTVANIKEHMSNLGKKTRKSSKELIELAERNCINIHTFYSRITRGLTELEAATIPLMSKVEIARRATETRKRNGTKCLGGLS
jgi:hypothetical protein